MCAISKSKFQIIFSMSRRASFTGGLKLPTGKSNGLAGQENGAPFGPAAPAAPPRKRWVLGLVSTTMGFYWPCKQTGQHWARMVWCSGRRTTSLTWVLRQQQARYYVQKARKVFWSRAFYILHKTYNPVDDISFNIQYIISTTRKDSISSTLKPGRGLREPSMDRGSKVGNLTFYTCHLWGKKNIKRFIDLELL